MLKFQVQAKDKRARAGVLELPHGVVHTPVFMPVGTQASVKSLTADDVKSLGAEIMLSNTYHLYLRPGAELIEKMGGINNFMKWDKPVLTDSGGFQVMSLGARASARIGESGDVESLVKIDEEGVTFKSHLDGSEHRFTPESAIKTQHLIGADIIMAFDEATADHLGKEYAQKAMERTHRWAKRSLDEHKKLGGDQSLFGIVQGSIHEDLRKESVQFISSLDFDGIALGGEAVGYNNQATQDILKWMEGLWPEDKPHYAMGVGEVETAFYVVEGGVDMFDCVSPTRRARNGSLYICPKSGGNPKNKFTLAISRSEFKEDTQPIDPECGCYTCQTFTRAYLRHLFIASELTYHRLATIHNVYFMVQLVKKMRESIIEKRFDALKKEWLGF